jgi:RimJ/RimL family protein N-acetyltransferase
MDPDASPAAADFGTSTSIESERVRLVPMTPADVDELFVLLDDPRLHAFTGGEPRTREELGRWLQLVGSGRSPSGDEVWSNWIIRKREGGVAIGTAQATISADEGTLAWVIGIGWQGEGFAKEAAGAVAAWLRSRGISRLRAHIHPDHFASSAVARSIGLIETNERVDGEVVWRAG